MINQMWNFIFPVKILRSVSLGYYASMGNLGKFKQQDVEQVLDNFEWDQPWKIRYHSNQAARYAATLNYLSTIQTDLKVLEIGAKPYGLTLLLRHFLFKDIAATQFDAVGKRLATTNKHNAVTLFSKDKSLKYAIPVIDFNLEKDPWPYEDQSFDLIIACEVFEHLAYDPMHLLVEANRILRPGGKIFISTPNVMSLWKINQLFDGFQPNVDPFYRLESVYSRHNRELTPYEISHLLECGGFKIEMLETINVKRMPVSNYLRFYCVRMLAGNRSFRNDLVFAIGIKAGPVQERYPEKFQLYNKMAVELYLAEQGKVQ